MGIILSEISNRKDQIKEYIRFQKIAEPAFGDFLFSKHLRVRQVIFQIFFTSIYKSKIRVESQ